MPEVSVCGGATAIAAGALVLDAGGGATAVAAGWPAAGLPVAGGAAGDVQASELAKVRLAAASARRR